MEKIIIKNPDQIDGIRKSSKLAGKTLEFIAPFVKEGVSTEFLDQKIEAFIRENGAIPATLGYGGYPKSCCISLNEVICHGIPSEKTILKNGDILNIDVTTILNGYYGDTSKMYTVGEVSPIALDLIEVAKQGHLDTVIVNTELQPGADNSESARAEVAKKVRERIKTLVGITTEVIVHHAFTLQRSEVGKAKRVIDSRQH